VATLDNPSLGERCAFIAKNGMSFDDFWPWVRVGRADCGFAPACGESVPGGSKFSFIRIEGHADRVDSPGLSPEARRAKELESSDLRAEAAQAFFFDEIAKRLLARGFVVPADLASAQNIFIDRVACGAARLKHTVPTGEPQRRENRRVEILAVDFSPSDPN
jgi:hypothetical protein